MTGPSLAVQANNIRFQLVVHGITPAPIFDQTAIDVVKAACMQHVAELHMQRRFAHVLQLIARPDRPSGWACDVQIALGEYETYLVLSGRAAA